MHYDIEAECFLAEQVKMANDLVDEVECAGRFKGVFQVVHLGFV